jgi:NADPH:quinone reductase-like Zn-dependent oxidoreductase
VGVTLADGAVVALAGVAVGEDLAGTREQGPYDVILDAVGGEPLAVALEGLAAGGVCVTFGAAGSSRVTLELQRLYLRGGTCIYGFYLFDELARRSTARELARLVALVADGRLRPHVAVEAPWTEIADRATQLLDRRVVGKIVLHVA